MSLLELKSYYGTPQLKAFHSEWIIAIHDNTDGPHKHEVDKTQESMNCVIPLYKVQNQEKQICY